MFGEEQTLIILKKVGRLTLQHLFLVFAALAGSLLIGVPLGVLGHNSKRAGQILLAFNNIFQAIPSLILLCFMLPVIGGGPVPALAALILYGLFPIVRSTLLGLESSDSSLKKASAFIFSGAKISAVANVGTAALAAFIGAGGLGVPIVTGLALKDISMIIWQGAIPVAVLAISIQWMFEGVNVWVERR